MEFDIPVLVFTEITCDFHLNLHPTYGIYKSCKARYVHDIYRTQYVAHQG